MTKHTSIIFFACVKCGIEKPHTAEYFTNDGPRRGYTVRKTCRECNAKRCRDRYHANKEDAAIKARRWREANKEYLQEYEANRRETERYAGSDYQKQKWAKSDKAKARADVDLWKAENPDKARAIEVARNKRIKRQRIDDPGFREKLNKKSRDWRRNKLRTDPEYKERAYAATREWVQDNPEWARENGRKQRLRQKDNPNYKIMASVRARLVQALRGKRKGKRTTELLGAPIDVIKAHIEAQFVDGMTWDNWGRGWYGAREWHLDHVRPLSSFDLTDPEQLAEAAHYTNLQPLWAKDNLRKGAKYGI